MRGYVWKCPECGRRWWVSGEHIGHEECRDCIRKRTLKKLSPRKPC